MAQSWQNLRAAVAAQLEQDKVKAQRRRRKLNTALATLMADAFNAWILMLILPDLFHTGHFGYLELWIFMMVITGAIACGVHSGFSSFTTAVEQSIKE